MFPPLDSLLTSMRTGVQPQGGGGLALPASPTPPLTMPAPTAPLQQPQQPRGFKGADLLAQIAPMVLAAFQSRRDPAAAGALLQGVVRGQQMAQQERLKAEERAQEQKLLAAKYMQSVAADAQQFDDPVDFQSYLSLAEKIGTELGVEPGAIRSIPFPASKRAAKVKKSAGDRLASIERDPRWAQQIGTPEFEQGVSVELEGVGRKTIAELRALAGLELYKGDQQIAPPQIAPKENEPGSFPWLYARARDAKEQELGRPLSKAEEYGLAREVKEGPQKPEADPVSVKEWKFYQSQGGKLGYDAWMTADANRKRSVTTIHQATQETEIEQAARNIVNNPNDLTSLKILATLRGDQRLRIYNRIKQLSPSFDPGLVDRKIKFLDSYENPAGRAALNRASMNNILQHAGDLSEVNQKYRRSNLRVTNTPLNALARQQSPVWTEYQTTIDVLREEIALYFAGGYAPQAEQEKAWARILHGDATPAQIEAFAKQIVHVGLRRANTHNQQFRTMMGYDDPNLLTPDAVLAGEKLGIEEVRRYRSGGQIGQPQSGSTAKPVMVWNPATGRLEPKR